ncbi:hypothetical protein J6590_039077 [Homalodisca vitripennis]|nr:hypothetical protein J6590_039077 [Homalodisca vitripennis]
MFRRPASVLKKSNLLDSHTALADKKLVLSVIHENKKRRKLADDVGGSAAVGGTAMFTNSVWCGRYPYNSVYNVSASAGGCACGGGYRPSPPPPGRRVVRANLTQSSLSLLVPGVSPPSSTLYIPLSSSRTLTTAESKRRFLLTSSKRSTRELHITTYSNVLEKRNGYCEAHPEAVDPIDTADTEVHITETPTRRLLFLEKKCVYAKRGDGWRMQELSLNISNVIGLQLALQRNSDEVIVTSSRPLAPVIPEWRRQTSSP